MSDQTPPNSDEPEATPDGEQHPVEPTSAEETAPIQPVPAETAATEPTTAEQATTPTAEEPPPPVDPAYAAAPPPAEKKSGRGRLIGIIAAVVVVVLVAGGLGFFFLLKSDAHKITTPATAGSMKRDTSKEKALGTQLDQAEQQFKSQGEGKGSDISYVKSAVYNQADTKRGPEGALVFLGAKLNKEQSPSKWVSDRFTKQAKANGLTVTNIDPGDAGGKAVCAAVTAPQQVAICAWATHDTIGELVPTVAGYDAKKLSKIMLDLRDDVEQPE